ncbi:Flagellin [Bacillus sp. THAF10]|uniref:flagellin N-terminal helical domain-containing protein n=1 Tax=Bacillus sp. THAF10 TaxID=2587848 RepID=UPI0012681583|nr:flagellin [Bacillus sp. THAF10]QFT90644.1 Flagellin [Bacillus sp. THAF10]
MRINHNIAALNTHRQLGSANNAQMKSMEKLSSGLRINKAGDDAAGLAISEKMRGQIRGLDMAAKNAQDGVSLLQSAEGALNETHSILQRMRELSVQANNDTNTNDDLGELQKEFNQLKDEVTRIGEKTEFNTKPLLTGSLGVQAAAGDGSNNTFTGAGISIDVSGVASGETLTFAVDETANEITVTGTNSGVSQTLSVTEVNTMSAGQTLNFDSLGLKLNFSANTDFSNATFDTETIVTSGNQLSFQIGANGGTTLDISIADMRSTALGTGTSVSGTVASINDVNLTSAGAGFDSNIEVIDKAITQVSAERSKLGAYQNRLEHTINNLGTSSENLTAAESRIRDVDYALAA